MRCFELDGKPDWGKHGDDLPRITGWKWGAKEQTKDRGTSTEGDNV